MPLEAKVMEVLRCRKLTTGQVTAICGKWVLPETACRNRRRYLRWQGNGDKEEDVMTMVTRGKKAVIATVLSGLQQRGKIRKCKSEGCDKLWELVGD